MDSSVSRKHYFIVAIHMTRKVDGSRARGKCDIGPVRDGVQMHEVQEFCGHVGVRTTELHFVRNEENAEQIGGVDLFSLARSVLNDGENSFRHFDQGRKESVAVLLRLPPL
jgi:hypothetical protein